jgi:1,4-dihydroxy-2-naphthoyl-CoA synthase
MTESACILEKGDGIAILTMNRPQAMNALNKELADSLYQAYVERHQQRSTSQNSIELHALKNCGRGHRATRTQCHLCILSFSPD